MKKLIVSLVLLIGISGLHAQDHIAFQKFSFSEAKAKAKKENKLIFLDGYTSWCAPCKWMEGNVFNQKEVADFYNSNFINTKFDCEVGEGIDIAKKYGIRSFPTYLFLDSEGALVYRTGNRMEVEKFLNEGKQAIDKNFQIPTLEARFATGDQDPAFLLRYIAVMASVQPNRVQEARKIMDNIADDSFLRSKIGWEAIKQLGQNGSDKYGRFFLANKAYLKSSVPEQEYNLKDKQLLRFSMYGYIRDNNKVEFDQGVAYFEESDEVESKIDAAMFRIDWVTAHGTDKEFVQLTNKLRKGILKDQGESLSFIARRNAGKYVQDKEPSKVLLNQCYVLAKQAVKLDAASYSNQGTFADICISLKKKKEAVKAAEAARALAEQETSKIIKLADALVERAKSI
ncbi:MULTISPECIES: thioredoxin family protein [Sphingobacterium]|uniref:thioredoxin family protein n=1 Tax=Sphingobacterium TaxID=28453 RepID=UPI0013DA8573|nr:MULTISPECIES: thioredoxin family protein [unclassified Sphingobacterium]